MVHIHSFEELTECMSRLHDCPFDLNSSFSKKTSRTWSGTFLRPLWDDPRAEHHGVSLLYVRSRLPVAEVIVTIAGVRKVEVMDDQEIGRYTFNEIEYDSNELRLLFNERMNIHVQLSGQIEATYDEQLLPGHCAVYRQFLLVQSGPKIETVIGADAK